MFDGSKERHSIPLEQSSHPVALAMLALVVAVDVDVDVEGRRCVVHAPTQIRRLRGFLSGAPVRRVR